MTLRCTQFAAVVCVCQHSIVFVASRRGGAMCAPCLPLFASVGTVLLHCEQESGAEARPCLLDLKFAGFVMVVSCAFVSVGVEEEDSVSGNSGIRGLICRRGTDPGHPMQCRRAALQHKCSQCMMHPALA